MTLDEILDDIKLNLKGIIVDDIIYLLKEIEKYKFHEKRNDIILFSDIFINKIATEEIKNDLKKINNQNRLNIEKKIEDIDFLIFKDKKTEAYNKIEELVNQIEINNWYSEDKICEYHFFDNLLEEILYKEICKPRKVIRRIPENYALAYYRYGELLFEFGKYDEAKEALEKASKYNPVSTTILFELSEIYKIRKDWENYCGFITICFAYSYSIKDIARCYRGLGYYNIEKNNLELAVALYNFSSIFEPNNKNTQSELFYISQKFNFNVNKINTKIILDLLTKNNIPIGANKLVLNIAYNIGQHAKKMNDINTAKYYIGIVCELTGDEKIIEEWNSL